MKKRYSEKDAQSRFCKKDNLIKSLTCLIVFFYLFSFIFSDLVIFGDYSLEIEEDTANSHNSENNKKLPDKIKLEKSKVQKIKDAKYNLATISQKSFNNNIEKYNLNTSIKSNIIAKNLLWMRHLF